MQLKTFDLNDNYYICIDPGCRTNGGTGIALFSKEEKFPLQVKLCEGKAKTNWNDNIEWVLLQVQNRNRS